MAKSAKPFDSEKTLPFPNYKEILINSITPYANNSRTHSPEQIEQIVRSIKEFGFTNPLLIDENNNVIAGHGRLEAAKILALESLPCIVLSHLTKAQKRAYIIADNKLALNAGWDFTRLQEEFAFLKDNDFNIELTGFSIEELCELFPDELPEAFCDEDDCPEVTDETITRPGDVWLLGDHRLLCGDSTVATDVERLMNGLKGNSLFTSPPYNAVGVAQIGANKSMKDSKYHQYDDSKSEEEYLSFISSFTSTWISHCNFICINLQHLAGNKISFIEYLYAYRKNIIDIAIWNKSKGAQPAMAKNVMNSGFEYLLFLSENEKPTKSIPGAKFRGNITNVYEAPGQRNHEFSHVHSATFPVHLPEWFLNSFTKKNDLIIDCFGGTGTTLIACEKLKRKCYMMELDPKYCDVIIKRYENYSGKKAVLEQ